MEPFIDFSFGGVNNISLHIKRVSNGSRYTERITPNIKDSTIDIPGGDGQYLLSSFYSSAPITINYAFDSMTNEDIRQFKKVFDGKEIKKLIFAEHNDRYYMAKVSSNPSMTYIAFDKDDDLVYKGEGTIQFQCYCPFALSNTPKSNGYNEGDIAVPFIIELNNGANNITINNKQQTITIYGEDNNTYVWDTEIGLIYLKDNKLKVVKADSTCGFTPKIEINGRIPTGATIIERYY